MTMHLAPVHITTTKYNGKGKRVPNSAAIRKAKTDHNEWLLKQGVHPTQLKSKKTTSTANIPDYRVDNPYELSNNLSVKGGFKTGIMNNLHKESQEVQAEIRNKAKQTAPAYNKGGYQYITPGADLSDIGKKK